MDETLAVFDALRRRDPAPGVMFDVGASVGKTLAPFAEADWTVHAFEPNPEALARLTEQWGRRDNVHVDGRALSDRDETARPFYTSDVSAGIAGLLAFDPSHTQAATVDTTTLAAYAAAAGVDAIDVLKIDTEGYDLPVLRGLDWDHLRPRIVITEFDDNKTQHLGYAFDDLAGFLAGKGYRVLVSEWFPLVRYGAGHRWRRLWDYPGPLADAKAWGNLVAVRDEADVPGLRESLAAAGEESQTRPPGPSERRSLPGRLAHMGWEIVKWHGKWAGLGLLVSIVLAVLAATTQGAARIVAAVGLVLVIFATIGYAHVRTLAEIRDERRRPGPR